MSETFEGRTCSNCKFWNSVYHDNEGRCESVEARARVYPHVAFVFNHYEGEIPKRLREMTVNAFTILTGDTWFCADHQRDGENIGWHEAEMNRLEKENI